MDLTPAERLVDEVLSAQRAKGREKYGLDHADGHDWPMEALQELADATQYLAAEVVRLRALRVELEPSGGLTDEQIREARALCEAATPGPWHVGHAERWHVYGDPDNPGLMAAGYGIGRVMLRMNEHFPYEADAVFIARARTLVPALLDEVVRLRKQNAHLCGAMQAQDERERLAGERCGVPTTQRGCDWPDAVADEVLALRRDLALARGEVRVLHNAVRHQRDRLDEHVCRGCGEPPEDADGWCRACRVEVDATSNPSAALNGSGGNGEATMLPHPALVVEVREWLRAGCPLVSRDVDPGRARQTLLALLDALPSHLDIYCHGTPANREAGRERPDAARGES